MLTENEDYYIDKGLYVFTEKYLKNRGYCCGNGCRHCPYEYINAKEPLRTFLLSQRQENEVKENK